MTHHEPPHLDLHCLLSQLFLSLVLNDELKQVASGRFNLGFCLTLGSMCMYVCVGGGRGRGRGVRMEGRLFLCKAVLLESIYSSSLQVYSWICLYTSNKTYT